MTTKAPAPSSTGPLAAVRNGLERLARFAAEHTRGFTIANIIGQGVIIVTGGAVRLTGSGLGCSTWPQCEPGTFVPVDVPESSLHPYIEFGNRTLTFVLTLIAAGVAVGIWRNRPDLRRWGLVPLIGVIAQAVLGGVTVLTGLNPVAVAPHFLISTLLVWHGVWLALTFSKAPRRVGRDLDRPLWLLTGLLGVLLFLGTLTTGAGPHSGDAEATNRLGLDPALIARAHALSVWAFCLVLAYVIFAVRRDRSEDGSTRVARAVVVLAAVTAAQGAIGYIQYFTDLPEILVGTHLAGAAALTAAHAAVFYLLRTSRVAR